MKCQKDTSNSTPEDVVNLEGLLDFQENEPSAQEKTDVLEIQQNNGTQTFKLKKNVRRTQKDTSKFLKDVKPECLFDLHENEPSTQKKADVLQIQHNNDGI